MPTGEMVHPHVRRLEDGSIVDSSAVAFPGEPLFLEWLETAIPCPEKDLDWATRLVEQVRASRESRGGD
jgi:hypothetical protein